MRLLTLFYASTGILGVNAAMVPPVLDAPFIQEYHEAYPIETDGAANEVRAVAVDNNGAVWAATRAGLYVLRAGEWSQQAGVTAGPLYDLHVDGENRVWVGAWDGVYRVEEGIAQKEAAVTGTAVAIGEGPDGLIALGPEGSWHRPDQTWKPIENEWSRHVRDVAVSLTSNAEGQNASQGVAMSDHYDLIVVGIGSGGFGAALAGARLGLSVLCLEKADRIGGNAARSGVTMWEPGVGGTGFPFEIYKRLKKTPDAVGVYSFGRHFSWDGRDSFPGGEHVVDPSHRYIDTLRRHRSREKNSDPAFRKEYWHGVVFEPDVYEQVLRAMLAETGRVTVLTETTFDTVDVEDGRITGMTLTNGKRVTAGAYIDGTGGGALCKAAGCEMMYGQESRERFNEPSAAEKPNKRINGVTLIFRVTKTDEPRVEPLPEGIPAECWWGRFPAMSAVKYPNGDYNCNMLPTMEGSHFAKMGYEKAYEECQRRIRAFWHYVQTDWPEFQAYRIKWVAPALGVRETSRVLGEYVLCEPDLRAGLSGQQHPDIITIADHSIDRHGAGGGGGEMGEPYGVPYRCLIPKGYKNLLIACRGSSFSSLAASSCRLSRTMMQLGQAAGTAVGVANQLAVALPDVPPEKLRAALTDQRVELTWPRSPDLEAYLRKE